VEHGSEADLSGLRKPDVVGRPGIGVPGQFSFRVFPLQRKATRVRTAEGSEPLAGYEIADGLTEVGVNGQPGRLSQRPRVAPIGLFVTASELG
jgi:hypothetical protein